MANPYEMFETSEELEQQGIVLDYGDFRIRIAHAGGSNKKYGKTLTRRLRPFEKQIAAGTADDEVLSKIIREVFCETVVLGFEVKAEKGYVEGVPAKDGKVNPYNSAEVNRIFTELPKLYQDVKKQAEDFALFRVVEEEETIKN